MFNFQTLTIQWGLLVSSKVAVLESHPLRQILYSNTNIRLLGDQELQRRQGLAFSICSIYPEPPISQRNFGTILIRLAIKEMEFAGYL